jgi:diguanylate cyclase (GGDEF)-like protein
MKYQYINKYILLLFVVLIAFVGYLQYSVMQNTAKLKAQEISKTKEYATKIVQYITTKVPKDLDKSLQNTALRDELNILLNTFMTEKYKYIFLLDKKNDKYYRFLLDGSKNNPEEFHSIFFPRSKLYDEVYKTQTIKLIKQKDDVENVWLSILAPVVYDKETKALLVLDLSKEYGNYIENFNSPISNLIRLMQLFLLVSLLVLIIVFYRYYKFRKHILLDKVTQAYTKLSLEEFFVKRKPKNEYVFMIDIDSFRVINTKYGYKVGNKILKEFVDCIKSSIEDNKKMIFKIGGGEFVVILPQKDKPLKSVANELFNRLKDKKYFVNEDKVTLSISMSGMMIYDEMSLYKVLNILDEKLLEVKSRGKNSFAIIDEKDKESILYKDLDFIKQHLENEEFTCLYQPIFDTKTKQIVKYEALVRMQDSGKCISPYYFLDVIRGTTQYIKMSKLVFKDIFATLKKYPHIHISANMHLDDLYNTDMMSMIIEQLFYHKEYAPRLTFEILEDKNIFDYQRVNEIFMHLKAYGSKIAIDDFGSGYANFNYLVKLDVDIVKIDSTLIKELKIQPQKSILVLKAIKQLANELGCEVIAEFVSDEEVYNYMLDIGIEYSQGYYLGEPKFIQEYLD